MDDPQEDRRCSRCGEMRRPDEYYASDTTASGYRYECKYCYKKYRRELAQRRKENPEEPKRKYTSSPERVGKTRETKARARTIVVVGCPDDGWPRGSLLLARDLTDMLKVGWLPPGMKIYKKTTKRTYIVRGREYREQYLEEVQS